MRQISQDLLHEDRESGKNIQCLLQSTKEACSRYEEAGKQYQAEEGNLEEIVNFDYYVQHGLY